ncbi:hypothetical protein BS329_29055 [Amycolatopsis coloradensis]|uniref:Mce-associated membrane protein n=1 Tax=Amycolatopsis coloradensis TaxID=76021 RepID=A0A1R0KMI8_9PSEU|nr:hypothetical protein BS329_29055 [Amycolatopsis coloradensis]
MAGLRRPGSSPASEVDTAPSVEETPEVKPAPVRRPSPRPAPRPAPEPVEVAEESAEVSEAAEPEVAAVEAPESTEAAEEVAEEEVVAKPSPRAKARAVAEAKPDDIEEAEAEVASEADSDSDSDEKPGKAKKPFSGQLILASALVVVGLLLAASAVVFKIQADDVSSSTDNTALLDVAKTAQVKDQVAKATEALFSYDYNNIAKTETAAGDLLVNDEVRAKYNLLMGEVKRLAPQQKMVVTCKVTRSAVIRLEGDRADVMVFVDQSSTRADTNKTTAGSAQLHLNAELQGDKWKITAMNTYAAPPNPAASSAPAAPPASPAPSK